MGLGLGLRLGLRLGFGLGLRLGDGGVGGAVVVGRWWWGGGGGVVVHRKMRTALGFLSGPGRLIFSCSPMAISTAPASLNRM